MKRDLKLNDLKERSEIVPMKLLSVRVPVDLITRIDQVVDLLNAGKGEVVVALLNEGLERYGPGGAKVKARDRKESKVAASSCPSARRATRHGPSWTYALPYPARGRPAAGIRAARGAREGTDRGAVRAACHVPVRVLAEPAFGGVPKWLRERSAKPPFSGSNPLAASSPSRLPPRRRETDLRHLTGEKPRRLAACGMVVGGPQRSMRERNSRMPMNGRVRISVPARLGAEKSSKWNGTTTLGFSIWITLRGSRPPFSIPAHRGRERRNDARPARMR